MSMWADVKIPMNIIEMVEKFTPDIYIKQNGKTIHIISADYITNNYVGIVGCYDNRGGRGICQSKSCRTEEFDGDINGKFELEITYSNIYTVKHGKMKLWKKKDGSYDVINFICIDFDGTNGNNTITLKTA